MGLKKNRNIYPTIKRSDIFANDGIIHILSEYETKLGITSHSSRNQVKHVLRNLTLFSPLARAQILIFATLVDIIIDQE